MHSVSDTPVPRRVDGLDREIAAQLREARVNAGLTQHEMAKQLGVSYQQFQKYERGMNRISGSILCRAAEVLGVPPSTLLPSFAAVEPLVSPKKASAEKKSASALQVGAAPRAVPRSGNPVASAQDLNSKSDEQLAEFNAICERILRLRSPRLRRALIAVLEQSVAD